jgi:hypothetical protein
VGLPEHGPLPSARGIASRLPFPEPCLCRRGVVRIGVESKSPEQFPRGAALMETLKAPDTARGEMTRIGKSVVIKGNSRAAKTFI